MNICRPKKQTTFSGQKLLAGFKVKPFSLQLSALPSAVELNLEVFIANSMDPNLDCSISV